MEESVSHDISAVPDSSGRPWLTIVSAVYGVAAYMPDFIASVEAQGEALEGVEVILVDDGSTDRSGEIADEWASRRPELVKVIHQPNGGQSAARNAGTRAARGVWITYPDPDDILAPNYLAEVRAFLSKHPSVSLAAAHLVFFREQSGRIEDTHPLSYRFRPGNHVADLDRFPDYFHLHLASSFLRLDALRAHGIEGDPLVRPVGEDGHVVGRYLLAHEPPLLGLVDTARYLYRKRADMSSTIDTSRLLPSRFTAPLRHGLLDLIRFAEDRRGHVPRWLQTELVYELQWLLRPDLMSGGGVPNAADLGVEDEFHDLVQQIVAHLDRDVVLGYSVTALPVLIRLALAHGFRDAPWHSPEVELAEIDTAERWIKLRYRYSGEAPAERVLVNGRVVPEPTYATRRRIDFSGRPVLWERIIWLPMRGQIGVELNGSRMPLTRRPHLAVKTEVRARDIDRMFGVKPRFASSSRVRPPATAAIRQRWSKALGQAAWRKRAVQCTTWLATSRVVQHLFRDAWVLMDRENNSWDNAEHLFRHLRAHERSINAWFVIRKESADYKRLRRDGYRRVVPYGSLTWKLLALNARFLISSHADAYLHTPAELRPYGGAKWRFVFLQHGIAIHDISRWLNGKPIRLFITSTRDEHEYIAGENSPFAFTPREVKLTGLPRHDRLARVAASGVRRTILVMPTWRHYLVGKRLADGTRTLVDDFSSSEYAQRWAAVLADPQLHRIAREHDARIVFMPHPNLLEYLPGWDLPEVVEIATYADSDVQEMIAAAAVVVTDYSSVVMDAAFVRRPIVYYQFDRAEVFGGGHFTRLGYFEYERDGFGPVVVDAEDVVKEIGSALDAGGTPVAPYAERMDRTFGPADGRACRRVVNEIKKVEKAMRWV